ncbi:MAG: histidine phosphatase family protein [Microbacteriaceae bacterium]|nr:histidine phosphatase family protein [Microbacteriaceae bacterium]
MGATELWLVRHGESIANVAAARAEASGAERIDVEYRDADVPLSSDGERQAAALGEWLAANMGGRRPAAVWASSYLRAQQTIDIAMQKARLALTVRVDDRLRDRELGILDLLTSHGVAAIHPDEGARRDWIGRFYYRPPGGESWADVALRLRSFLRDVDLYDDGECVLVAAHDAIILLFLYVCGGQTEAQLLEFAGTHSVANASVTRLSRPAGVGLWTIESFAETEHIENSDAPVTEHPGETNENGA